MAKKILALTLLGLVFSTSAFAADVSSVKDLNAELDEELKDEEVVDEDA